MRNYLIAASALAVVCAPAHADILLDQSNIASPPQGGQIVIGLAGANFQIPNQGATFFDIDLAQSVTVGIGGKLSSVDLQLARLGQVDPASQYSVTFAKDVTFNPDGSVSGATVLGEFDLSIAALNTPPLGSITNIDTSALNINFNAGDVFWIALGGSSNHSMLGWAVGTSATIPPSNPTPLVYVGGAGYSAAIVSGSGNPLKYSTNGQDYGFRTWMETAVPEPASWAMMIVGFAVVGSAMRRRQQAAVSFA